MAIYTYPLEIPRWSGEVDQLVAAMEFARSSFDSEITLSITLKGLNIRDATIDDLAKLSGDDRARLRRIEFSVGSGFNRAGIELHLDGGVMGNGLTLQVADEDRTRAMGLFQRLQEILTPRSPGWLTPWRTGVAAIAVLFLMWLLLLERLSTPPTFVGFLVAMATVFGATGLAVLACNWIFTPVELLAAGDRPRSRRFRAGIAAFIVAVVAGIVSTMFTTR